MPARARLFRFDARDGAGFPGAVPVVLAAMLAACSGTSDGPSLPAANPLVGLATVTGYQKINALQPTGFAEQQTGPDAWRVLARGSPATPLERLEKIVLARAAEIGVETKHAFFKPGPFTRSTSCKDARDLPHKSGRTAAERFFVVEIEIVYAPRQLDPAFLPSAATFARLSAEIAGDQVGADAKAASLAAMQSACGK